MTRLILITAMAVLIPAVTADAADARQLSCSGSMIEPTGSPATPKTVKLTLGSAKDVSVDLGSGTINASVVSNNRVQLKFETKDFVGEFFHYTGDLFFIYPSGHLARFQCLPS